MNLKNIAVLVLGLLSPLVLAQEKSASIIVDNTPIIVQVEAKPSLDQKKIKQNEKAMILLKMLVKRKECRSWPSC